MSKSETKELILNELAQGRLTVEQALAQLVAAGVDEAFAREEISITLGGSDCVSV